MGLVYRQSNQENLEHAFTVAERELGVTRLLDPEGERRHKTILLGGPWNMWIVYIQTLRPIQQIYEALLSLLFFTDVDVPHPDEKSIITYVSSLYDVMPRVPDVQDGIKANVSCLHPLHFMVPPQDIIYC